MKLNFVSFIVMIAFSLPACASTPSLATGNRDIDSVVRLQIQFFKGNIQRSSVDGKTPYGPQFESVVRRQVDLNIGKIIECVFQEGKVFISEMTRTSDPLIFSATDTAGSFNGNLVFEDADALAWSYDIQVTKPSPGRITGSLADGNGARIQPNTGKMTITKIWNDQVRIQEEYSAITETEYSNFLSQLPSSSLSSDVVKTCR
jgi:hypothetical protein